MAADYDADGSEKLAEAVVMRAVLDALALRCRRSASSYLRAWYYGDHPGQCGRPVPATWESAERLKLEMAFHDGLGDLALAVGKAHWIRKISGKRLKVNRYALRKSFKGAHYERFKPVPIGTNEDL